MANTDPLLSAVKLAIPVTSAAYDALLTDTINAAIKELNTLGIPTPEDHSAVTDPLHLRAIKTYVKAEFLKGDPVSDKLTESWHKQVAFMLQSTGYHHTAN